MTSTAAINVAWQRAVLTGITINCEGTGTGTHEDCHGWANPGSEYRRCTCACHLEWNTPWGFWAERNRVCR